MGDFNLNRVLKNNKDQDTKDWIKSLKALNKKICEYVKEYFKSSGLTYNAKGGALSDAKENVSEKKEEPKKEATKKSPTKGGAGGGMAAVMGDLSKGLSVTKGMKKV